MTALVTGAAGFIGNHVARLLIRRGERVRIVTRSTSSTRMLEGLACERVLADLRDTASLTPALVGIRTVYHVAADYRLWCRNPNEIYQNNVNGTVNLIRASRAAGVQRFVYTSTVGTIAVPGHADLPNEDTQAGMDEMIGHYKRSKLLAEQRVLEAANDGFPAVIVNPTTPVGPGDWKPTPTGKIIVDFMNGRIPAYVDTGFNIVGVEDVAEGHLLAVSHGQIGHRYLLGCRNITLKELLDILAAITGRTSPRLRLPYAVAYGAGIAANLWSGFTGREPAIPLDGVRMARHHMFVDCSRATRELNFHPSGIEEALRRAVQWYVANGYVQSSRYSPQVLRKQPL